MKNLKEFKELIEKYESITLEQIQNTNPSLDFHPDDDDYGDEVANALTGFGRADTCTLCYAVFYNCKLCVYGSGDHIGCIYKDKESLATYHAISNAESPEMLLEGFENRVKYMKSLIE